MNPVRIPLNIPAHLPQPKGNREPGVSVYKWDRIIDVLITCHDETDTLESLLKVVTESRVVYKILILADRPTKETAEIMDKYNERMWYLGGGFSRFCYITHELNHNYSAHKNYGNAYMKSFAGNANKWVLQLDADEFVTPEALEYYAETIKLNDENTDLIFIPRINDFVGITPEIAKQWNWNIDNPNKWVNWNRGGDYQGRLYKLKDGVKWVGRLHERIQGYDKYAFIPREPELAILHRKPVSDAVETNLRYNQEFTQEENKGHQVI